MSNWFPSIDVPTLPVLDLITGRPGSSDSEVTAADMYGCQVRWDFIKIYRLEPSRRRELCSLRIKMSDKLSPDLKGSESYSLWDKVSKDPDWPDTLMSEQFEEDEEGDD